MRDYLKSLQSGDVNFESDEVTVEMDDSEVVQGDISEHVQVVEELTAEEEAQMIQQEAVADAAEAVLEEDTVTLESLMDGIKRSMASTNGLTYEAACYANNHIQSLTKRYGIEVDANINQESSTSDIGRLTLEAAEAADEGMWTRFKNMVINAIKAVWDFITGLFRTAGSYKKMADSIIVRAKAIKGGSGKVTIPLKGKAAELVVYSDKNFMGSVKEGLSLFTLFTSNLTDAEKAAKEAMSRQQGGDISTEGIDEELVNAILSTGAHNSVPRLPFGYTLERTGKFFSLVRKEGKKGAENLEETLSVSDVIFIADAAKKYIDMIQRQADSTKDALNQVTVAMKAAGVNFVKRTIIKTIARVGTWKMRRKAAELARNCCVVCLQVAGAALKSLEAEAK